MRDVDLRLRKLCLITDEEKGYPRSVLSRFTRRVGAESLWLIIEEKVIFLLRRAGVEEVDAVLDASFIKAWSIRSPDNNQTVSQTTRRGLGGAGGATISATSSTPRWSTAGSYRWRA